MGHEKLVQSSHISCSKLCPVESAALRRPHGVNTLVRRLVESDEVAALFGDAFVQVLLRKPRLAEQPALVPSRPIAQHRDWTGVSVNRVTKDGKTKQRVGSSIVSSASRGGSTQGAPNHPKHCRKGGSFVRSYGMRLKKTVLADIQVATTGCRAQQRPASVEDGRKKKCRHIPPLPSETKPCESAPL